MNAKTISILVPLYKKPSHRGQTPDVYPTTVTQKFERALVERCERVLRQRMGEELFLDKAHGEIEVKPHYRYDLTVDTSTPALAEIIGLALASFEIKTITIIRDDAEAVAFDLESAEELSIGAHAWSEA